MEHQTGAAYDNVDRIDVEHTIGGRHGEKQYFVRRMEGTYRQLLTGLHRDLVVTVHSAVKQHTL
jgi:hypothetical protein